MKMVNAGMRCMMCWFHQGSVRFTSKSLGELGFKKLSLLLVPHFTSPSSEDAGHSRRCSCPPGLQPSGCRKLDQQWVGRVDVMWAAQPHFLKGTCLLFTTSPPWADRQPGAGWGRDTSVYCVLPALPSHSPAHIVGPVLKDVAKDVTRSCQISHRKKCVQ